MFGMFLKQARESANLSQIEVSRMLGYQTSQFISNWERNVSTPPIPTIRHLGKIYSVDPETLFQATLEAKIEIVTKSLRAKFSESFSQTQA